MFVITVVHISYEKLISKLKVHVPHECLHAFSLRLIVGGEFKIRNRNGKAS